MKIAEVVCPRPYFAQSCPLFWGFSGAFFARDGRPRRRFCAVSTINEDLSVPERHLCEVSFADFQGGTVCVRA